MRVNILQIIWEVLTEFITGIIETVVDLILGILGKVKWIIKKILPF